LLRWSATEREAWLDAVMNPAPRDYCRTGYCRQIIWATSALAVRKDRRRVEVLRAASRQLRTFNTEKLPCKPLLHMQQRFVVSAGASFTK
jgi:hypothetical protein